MINILNRMNKKIERIHNKIIMAEKQDDDNQVLQLLKKHNELVKKRYELFIGKGIENG